MDEKSLAEIEPNCRQTAFESYNEKAYNVPLETAEKYRRKLKDLVDQALKRFKESNNHKQVCNVKKHYFCFTLKTHTDEKSYCLWYLIGPLVYRRI